MTTDETKDGGESTLTVLIALGANVGVGLLKLIAGLLTGSAAMLAEAAHSVADTATEALLLTALHRSGRKADRRHPFGYGMERFFWSLIAAVGIFVSGGVFAIYEGIHTIVDGEPDDSRAWVAYVVLAVSFVLEGISWLQGVKQVRADAVEHEQTPAEFLRTTDDPTVKTVFCEDSAALIGLVIAFLGVLLHQLTGAAVWDGVASILIGLLLTVVAYVLIGTNKGLLIGRQADARLVRAIGQFMASRPEVEEVVDILTMQLGTDQVLLCARLDFIDDLTAAQLERACIDIDAALRERFPDLTMIFLEPVPRADPGMRARVLARYGESTPSWRTAQEAAGETRITPDDDGGARVPSA